MAFSPCRSVTTRGFTPQHQQLPWAPVAQTRPLLSKKCSRHIHIQKGYENALPGTGVSPSLTMASASSAAAATPEPAPQVRPQQGLLTVRDMIQGASVCVLVALLLVVMSTLAVGGGLKVWHYLQGLHAQGVEAATWAELVGLVVTVAGGVWLAGTVVLSFAQATRGVEQLKQQHQELQRDLKQQQQEVQRDLKQQQQELQRELKQQQQELKQDMIDLKQELVSRLDRVLDRAYDKRLDAVEAAVYWRAGGQQASP